jgi:hypothetical protein
MTDEPNLVAAALVDRYTIERELGSGGMATVYLARDLKHERSVAVKVLRADLAAAVGSERFLREIRITAQLNHPHILPLLDSGEADGVLYYVMPYVTGGSLRPCLGGETPLPLEATLLITRQVASALDYAHRRQVIHRDIKPENILFSEGHAVVSDFGIAKAVSTVGRDALTRTGAPLGTPGYMSPEQAMAVADPDERTDVYSLACVVYEMLVGATPIVWPSDDDVRLGRLSDAPPEHRARLDALPGRVEQALTRALAVRPADRFPTPGELAQALEAATESGLKFSDAEVRRIIGRAAELQAEQPTEGSALSIGAVEQVAAEVGIPPEHVREAARELERRPAATPPATRSGPPRFFKSDKLRYTRIADGEVPESAHEALVEEIQKTLDIAGHVSSVGKALTWSPAAQGQEGRKLVVTITPEAGETRIHIEERQELAGWRLFVPGWGAALGALTTLPIWRLGNDPNPILLVLTLGFAVAGGVTTANLILWTGAQRKHPQLEQLADRLASLAEGAARPGLVGPARDPRSLPR